MKKILSNKIFTISVILLGVVFLFVYSTNKDQVDFSTQVKPIINKKCITCHGGIKKEGGFSLLFREEAIGNTKSGKPAIIAGDPDASELVRRITIDDPEERMPYKHDPLTTEEIRIFKGWIKQGAKWGEHWAYVAVKPVEVPKPESHLFGLIGGEKW